MAYIIMNHNSNKNPKTKNTLLEVSKDRPIFV